MLITISNDGAFITQTDFFEKYGDSGKFVFSVNARAFRILLPESMESQVWEMQTADSVIVTRGRWQTNNVAPLPIRHGEDAMEFLFEDHSKTPYILHTAMGACLDALPNRHDEGRTDLRCLVYVGKTFPKPVIDLPAAYRKTARVPYMKPLATSFN
jgi:hypothetical protein